MKYKFKLVIILFTIFVFTFPVSGIGFIYESPTVTEIDFNKFKLDIIINQPLTCSVVSNFINLEPEKSSNIVIDSCIKNNNNYIIYGHLKNYYISKNKLFNPWFNTSWKYKKPILINNTDNPNTLTNYQVNINISYNSNMNSDFSDIRIVNDTDNSLIPYWIESKVNSDYANIWANFSSIPASMWTNSTYYIYYGNPSAASASDGTNTFIQYHGAATANYHDTNIISVPFVWEGKVRRTSDNGWFMIGTSNQQTSYGGVGDDSLSISPQSQYELYGIQHNDGVESYFPVGLPVWELNQYYRIKIEARASNNIVYYVRDLITGTAITTNVPDATMGLNLYLYQGSNVEQEYTFIRKYALPEANALLGTEIVFTQINITSWSNNKTNNQSLTFSAYQNDNINFNITTNIISDITSWFLNDSNQSWNYNNITLNLSTLGLNYINVTVYNSTFDNYASKNWSVNIPEIELELEIELPLLNDYDVFISDLNNVYRINNGSIIYKIILNNAITTQMVNDSNSIYYGSNNILYSLDKRNGTIIYKIILNSVITIPIVINNNSIYYGSNNILYSSDKTTGTILYKNVVETNITKVIA